MGARQRLNSLYFLGAMFIAGLFGAATEFWGMFLLIAVLLIASLIHGGDIRPRPTRRRRVRR